MSSIEKNISFKIAQQFPAVYREYGAELVNLVEEYYKWSETASNQGIYNSRRLFEYRDIATTLNDMIIFFHKKYLSDLPLQQETSVRFIVKNILDLYRRKGSESGILLFFRLFYGTDAEVRYPSKHMLKPSDSSWKSGRYLQMVPNDGLFYTTDRTRYYQYKDLLSKNIRGSVSGATAAVDKINLVLLNDTLTPIIYLDGLKGSFQKFDNIIATLDGYDVSFGVVNGSASEIEIDIDWGGTPNHKLGDIFNIESKYGRGGKAIVTETREEATGIVEYTLTNGGYGYTVENTRLYVSDQVIVLNNKDFSFTPLERLRDAAGNEGIVIGQNSAAVGVLMNPGQSFIARNPDTGVQGSPISTLDRDVNITLPWFDPVNSPNGIISITEKNNSSPGDQYPDTGLLTDAKVGAMSDIETISLIVDLIQPYLNVAINDANYNTAGTVPMSGTADPVTLTTPLNQAFDLTPFDIGKIETYVNINPGIDYVNDVFCLVRDEQMIAFDRRDQIITVSDFSAAMSVGDRIEQVGSGVAGEITKLDPTNSGIYVRPYAYYGFDATNDIVHLGNRYPVVSVEKDYSSKKFGESAIMKTETKFATGRISKASVLNSGYGYVDQETIFLTNEDGVPAARGLLRANKQGITEGFWGSQTSHLNGYYIKQEKPSEKAIKPTDKFAYQVLAVAVGSPTSPADLEDWGTSLASDGFAYLDMSKNGSIQSNDAQAFLRLATNLGTLEELERWNTIVVPSLKEQSWYYTHPELYTYVDKLEYYDSLNKIQDSDYYQEYSYEILSTVDKRVYEKTLKKNMHLAGTKMFGNFVYKTKQEIGVTSKFNMIRKEDFIIGGDPVVGPNQPGFKLVISMDSTDFSVDSVNIPVDIQ